MIPNKWLPALAASTVIASLLLVGCSPDLSPSSDGTGTPQAGGHLVMARELDVMTLMPADASDNESIWTIEDIYDTLIVPSADGQSLKPSLATDWVQSEDKLAWTFTLRHGATFSDGTPLTSADVKFSLDAASDPNLPSGFLNEQIAGIDTPSPETVVVRTKTAWSPLPSVLALYANSIVPANYGGKSREEFAKAPVGSGPFKVKNWTQGQQLDLVKNTAYWGTDRPYLDAVTFVAVADANTRATQLQGGQITVNEMPAASSFAALSSTPGLKASAFDSSYTSFLSLNNTRAPFTDVHVRRAIAYAIDREAILKAANFGQGTAAGSFLSPAYWAYDANVKGRQFNLEEAKKEMGLSSKPAGFSADILVASGNATQLTTAQILQSELSEIGITLTINQMEPGALRATRKSMDYDMAISNATTDITDPDELVRFIAAKSGGSNAMYTGYDNQQVADLATQAASLSDQAKRLKIYSTIQQKVNDDQPMVPLLYQPTLYSYSDKVHDFQPSITGNYNLVNTWLSK
ncbi:ABC transporter substrate-binding protein [Arthrobacter sp. B2a2-09]|uniref:ABC transporter substrate-binding protein n=1 Tax=Arthrobacter sp. B2a2-09 TaxID=2952822 RepID=UPI0022CD404E|nr:ABC transporter substrate-binding protein [Arthrobacter sp. B2a2-09]MCZ9883196.1 ABC transporter substrate-binding protein [Arthrobacter sp. B2a2-09]